MKLTRLLLPALAISLSVGAFAQSPSDSKKPAAQTDAEKTFSQMKTLAGVWKGSLVTTPHIPEMEGKTMWVSLRVTSRGNALVHEMKEFGTPDDPTRYDDPITMLYLDGDRLLLTHYCDAGNRPRMAAKQMSADGKTVEFSFLDVAGGTEHGHMHNAVFTIKDANHHSEEWTYMEGDQPVLAHFELERVK
jgi:hypothetical protein